MNSIYSDAYKIQCRAIWYDNGCPPLKKFHEMKILPPNEHGITVEVNTLKHWMYDEDWWEWKDAQDAELSIRVEDELLNRKVELIKEQLNQVREVRNEAYQSIKKVGFDSSASAVSAFFKASAEERGLMQIEKVIEDLAKLQTNDLQRQFRELAERAGASDIEIVEEEKENE